MKIIRNLLLAFGIASAGWLVTINAQAPIPMGPGPVISAPGSPSGLGEGPAPAPGSDIYNPGPQVAPPPGPGNLNGPGEAPPPPMVLNAPLSSPNWQNNGTVNVMACGYDAQGVWRTIPLKVRYAYNGAQYDVTVISAWNPWTQMWNYDVDQPAFNTTYFLNGVSYNFYTNLSTGTFYFNL